MSLYRQAALHTLGWQLDTLDRQLIAQRPCPGGERMVWGGSPPVPSAAESSGERKVVQPGNLYTDTLLIIKDAPPRGPPKCHRHRPTVGS